jgi:hypothetical protein
MNIHPIEGTTKETIRPDSSDKGFVRIDDDGSRYESDYKVSSDELRKMLRDISSYSIHELDNLLHELQELRGKIETDGDRIQQDIAEYSTLSQQVLQVSKIMFDSVKKIPTKTTMSRRSRAV